MLAHATFLCPFFHRFVVHAIPHQLQPQQASGLCRHARVSYPEGVLAVRLVLHSYKRQPRRFGLARHITTFAALSPTLVSGAYLGRDLVSCKRKHSRRSPSSRSSLLLLWTTKS